MYLVVGASGLLGTEICRRLATAGRPVRAMVRASSDQARVEELRRLGAELVQGDLKEAESLAAACHGAVAVFSTATVTLSRQPGDTIQSVDLEGQSHLVDAARDAGVAQFIYVSYSTEEPCPLTGAKRAVEQRLQQSGLTFTILRPSMHTEVWLSPLLGFDIANAKATIFGSGRNPISWISRSDVAEFAVRSLEAPAARNAILELGGPEALSPLEVVRLCERMGGRPFTVVNVSEKELRTQMDAVSDALLKSLCALQIACGKGDHIDIQPALRAIPLQLTPVRDYVRRILAEAGISVKPNGAVGHTGL